MPPTGYGTTGRPGGAGGPPGGGRYWGGGGRGPAQDAPAVNTGSLGGHRVSRRVRFRYLVIGAALGAAWGVNGDLPAWEHALRLGLLIVVVVPMFALCRRYWFARTGRTDLTGGNMRWRQVGPSPTGPAPRSGAPDATRVSSRPINWPGSPPVPDRLIRACGRPTTNVHFPEGNDPIPLVHRESIVRQP
jgi:hypothetical protein